MSNLARPTAHKDTPSPNPDTLYQLAEPRAGYFTLSEAARAGYSRALLAHHVKSGLFERVGRGVYKLKRFPESSRADLIIAELRSGPDGVISHESALELYELSDVLPGEVHVTVPRTASRRKSGIRLHTGTVAEDEIRTWNSVSVTTVERTIADVARSGLSEQLVVSATRQALQRGLTTTSRLAQVADRRGGRAKRLVQKALQEVEP